MSGHSVVGSAGPGVIAGELRQQGYADDHHHDGDAQQQQQDHHRSPQLGIVLRSATAPHHRFVLPADLHHELPLTHDRRDSNAAAGQNIMVRASR